MAPLSSTSANVIWIPPVRPNGIITEYEVIYSVYADTDTRTSDTVASDETSFIIPDLGKQEIARIFQLHDLLDISEGSRYRQGCHI